VEITLRRARPDEARQLTELAVESKRYWGYPESLIELWRPDLEFTPASIRAQAVIVAELAGSLVGVSAVSGCGAAAELEGLWVRPAHMGHGVGRALFREAVAGARAQGAVSLVIASDPHAEPFYRRQGAVPAGSAPSTPAGRRLPRLVFHIGGGRDGRK
jgi:GNAT superfamily N-acetyltransferase